MLRPRLGQFFAEVTVITVGFGKARERQQLRAFSRQGKTEMASIAQIFLHLNRKRTVGAHDTLPGQGKATAASWVMLVLAEIVVVLRLR
jgi:hypothetical protein